MCRGIYEELRFSWISWFFAWASRRIAFCKGVFRQELPFSGLMKNCILHGFREELHFLWVSWLIAVPLACAGSCILHIENCLLEGTKSTLCCLIWLIFVTDFTRTAFFLDFMKNAVLAVSIPRHIQSHEFHNFSRAAWRIAVVHGFHTELHTLVVFREGFPSSWTARRIR